MATGTTRVSDVIVPEIFTPYVQQTTQEKSRLIQSGALVTDAALTDALAGGGVTFNSPSYKDLDNDVDNVSSDDPAVVSTANKISTSQEVQVRLSRNNSWDSMDLTSDLAGPDPMKAIARRVANYWTRRLQSAVIATIAGVFADNAAAPAGTEHVQNDMTVDIKGVGFVDGVTNFSAEAFIDAQLTMGDSLEDLKLIMVHSVVAGRMRKNDLIDFVVDSEGRFTMPTFQGLQVIIDDSMPVSAGVYESWIFGPGAIRLGTGAPKMPTEVDRRPDGGNGAGREILFNRTEWIIHPSGHKYAGTAANGGPSNASTANNLANAGSWQRVFPERKQIAIARLVTRES